MIYKIEIWQYHEKVATYKNKDIKKILKWYKKNWESVYDFGLCTFYLYRNEKDLSFKEKSKLGFF